MGLYLWEMCLSEEKPRYFRGAQLFCVVSVPWRSVPAPFNKQTNLDFGAEYPRLRQRLMGVRRAYLQRAVGGGGGGSAG